jgi:hypothetical protein
MSKAAGPARNAAGQFMSAAAFASLGTDRKGNDLTRRLRDDEGGVHEDDPMEPFLLRARVGFNAEAARDTYRYVCGLRPEIPAPYVARIVTALEAGVTL